MMLHAVICAVGCSEQNPLTQSVCSFHKSCPVLQEATVKSSYLQLEMVDDSDPSCKSNRAVTSRSSYFLDKSDGVGSDGKSKKIVVRSSYFKHNELRKSSKINEADVELVMDDSSADGENNKDHFEELCVKRKASPTQSNAEVSYTVFCVFFGGGGVGEGVSF